MTVSVWAGRSERPARPTALRSSAALGSRKPLAAVAEADENVLHGRQAEERAHQLKSARHAAPAEPVRGEPVNAVALKINLAGVGNERAAHEIEERGLPGAVGSHDAEDLAGFDRETHIPHRGDATEGLGDTVDAKKRHQVLKGRFAPRKSNRKERKRHRVRARHAVPFSSVQPSLASRRRSTAWISAGVTGYLWPNGGAG